MIGSQPDILVIGAGIAGASVAAELARTHRVVVLEAEDAPGYTRPAVPRPCSRSLTAMRRYAR
ncbi:MAG TPA: FAD-dependent oxidoreductase [Steroidobacteraceae bacterium]